ncbi:hypothetical protein GALMADRAFT_232924 [Galerina marginata CBS 339.88]|uniref:Uncharacterized protein n=1 Tax=Galerina marginata (strain CBS 339.88) TaxID=685588 RepID=A0A067SFJ1_GALM3|nr:hypothetical protein GALMADRAFT_232924 [Galerina marginata CBS 339.88]
MAPRQTRSSTNVPAPPTPAPPSPPKPRRGRKRVQSSAAESANKRSKADDDDNDAYEDDDADAGDAAAASSKPKPKHRAGGQAPGGTKATKAGGKGGKGKNRKTDAQRAEEDAVANAKGPPANPTPVLRVLEAENTSVAPPPRDPRSPTASFLPPAPTISSTRARVDREPDVTARGAKDGDDDSSSDEDDETSEGNGEADENFVDQTDPEQGGGSNDERDGMAIDDRGVNAPTTPAAVDADRRSSTKVHIRPAGLPVGPPRGKPKSALGAPDPSQLQSTAGGKGDKHRRRDDTDRDGDYPMHPPGPDDQAQRRVSRTGDLDISKLPPPDVEPPANGSSRATGGFSRGRAVGNAPNIGDSVTLNDQETFLPEGQVNLTIVPDPPGTTVIKDATSVITVNTPCFPTLAPLLKRVGRSYSPLRKNNHRVYVLKKKQWNMKGRYEIAIEDDEACVWAETTDGLVTHLLVETDRNDIMPPVVASAIPPSFHRRSSVPQSSSVTSRTPSASAASADPFGGPSGGPSKLSREKKDLVLEYLGIDPDLPYLGPPGLPAAYQKFKAISGAVDEVLKLGSDPEWEAQFIDEPAWTIKVPEFIDIFVAKSQYYKTWRKKFLRASKFSVMVDWLNQTEDRLSNEEIWGPGPKASITFRDLETWLQKKERDAVVKGKAKAGSSSKGKKHDGRDRGVERKSHKKDVEKEKKGKSKARESSDEESDE